MKRLKYLLTILWCLGFWIFGLFYYPISDNKTFTFFCISIQILCFTYWVFVWFFEEMEIN